MPNNITTKASIRAKVLDEVIAGELNQSEAGRHLELTREHVNRLLKAYRFSGIEALVSKRIGKPNVRALSSSVKEEIIRLLRLDRYRDFAPSFATRVLKEYHDIDYSTGTIRKLMMEAGLWRAKSKKNKRTFQYRQRRPRPGELIQIDGSYHRWFKDRGEQCCLIVFIDDATGRITARFFKTETTFAYMEVLNDYIDRYGIPQALYHDRHSIFTTAETEDKMRRSQTTSFGRMLDGLKIESINARTPQAKGRVERMNQTLQEHLVNHLQIRGIDTIDEANDFLDETFVDSFNDRFAKLPANGEDAHTKDVYGEEERFKMACKLEHRLVANDVGIRYQGRRLVIQSFGGGHHLKGKRIEVRTHLDNQIRLWYKDKCYDYDATGRNNRPKEADSKTLQAIIQEKLARTVKEKKIRRPDHTHPYKRTYGRKLSKPGSIYRPEV